jgi:hypothetical protein
LLMSVSAICNLAKTQAQGVFFFLLLFFICNTNCFLFACFLVYLCRYHCMHRRLPPLTCLVVCIVHMAGLVS